MIASTVASAVAENTNVVNNAVAGIITKAVSSVDAAASFLSAQIPDVIHQLLVWELVKSGIYIGVVLLVLFLLYHVYKRGCLYVDSNNHGWLVDRYGRAYDDSMIYLMMGIVSAGLGCVILFREILNIAKILITPKIFLIEYAAYLIK